MAASLAFALVKNHAFVDGNKRVGLSAMLTFLRLNGLVIQAPSSWVDVFENLAVGIVTRDDLAGEIAREMGCDVEIEPDD